MSQQATKPKNNMKDDLKHATGLEAVSKISDRDQILFLQETTAFPLRAIRDVGILRDLYCEYVRAPGNVPVHIQSSFDPPLPDLFLMSQEERRRVADVEEALVIGRVDGRVRVETNRREGCDELRYRYHDLGSDTFVRLGAGWDDAFEFLLADTDASEEVRRRLTSEVAKLMRSLDTPTKRQEFSGHLTAYLGTVVISFELGDEDAMYQRLDRIRRDIMVRYKLPVVTSAAPGSGPARQPAPSDADDKFLALLRTTLKNARGSLMPRCRTRSKRAGGFEHLGRASSAAADSGRDRARRVGRYC